MAQTSTEYLDHHLRFLTIGEGFWTFHIDSLIVSFLIATILILILFGVSRKPVVIGKPGKIQALVEITLEWVNHLVIDITGNKKSKFVAPLALTVFLYILIMNFVDLIPVDWIPGLVGHIIPTSWFPEIAAETDHLYFRPLPTADLNIIIGFIVVIVILSIIFGFKYKGFNYTKDFYLHPFNSYLMIPVNLVLEIVSFTAKHLSLTLRLYGNMYAGEVIFLLIAIMYSSNLILSIGAVPVQLAWSLLHVLVIFLQAFVFMILTIIYLTQAAQSDH